MADILIVLVVGVYFMIKHLTDRVTVHLYKCDLSFVSILLLRSEILKFRCSIGLHFFQTCIICHETHWGI